MPNTDDQSAHVPFRIVVLTPLGQNGRGGIDRVMNNIRNRSDKNQNSSVRIQFLTTRGKGSLVWMPVYFCQAAVMLLYLKLIGMVDLVHINLSSHGSVHRKMKLASICLALNIPYVIHLHGSRFRQYWDGLPRKQSNALARMFEQSASIYVLGNIWMDYIQKKVLSTAGKCSVLPNATPRHIQIPVENEDAKAEVTVLFLGLLGERKGTSDLINALARSKPKFGWKAILGGNGDVEGAIALSKKLGIDDKIEFPGWLSPDLVARLLDTSDILVLPSYDENLPMSVIEGMAAGLAVLTTPVGATEDIIRDGETGLLVKPGDIESLTRALERLIDNPDLRKRLGAAALLFHEENLEIDGYCRRLESLWQDSILHSSMK